MTTDVVPALQETMTAVSRFEANLGTMVVPLDQNPAAVYLARLGSVNSKSSAYWHLKVAAEILSGGKHELFTLNWAGLKYQHLAAFMTRLQQPNPRPGREEPYPFQTVNLFLSFTKGVIREAWKLGLVADHDYLRIMAEKCLRGEAPPAGRALTEGEKIALFKACEVDQRPIGIRDAAVFALMLGAGLRRAEVAGLDLRDWQAPRRTILVRKGKGRRYREVPVGERVECALNDWLHFRGTEPGPLFLRLNKAGAISSTRLSDFGLYFMIDRRSEEAGIDPRVRPHDLRRTYITDLLTKDVDLATTAKLAGHKSPVVTMRYDKRGEQALRVAAEKVEIPYTPREMR